MRVVICDDHRLLLEALDLALTTRGLDVVALANDPDEAAVAVSEHRPDVCLLDVHFGAGTAVSAISRLREVSPETKVVMMSAFAEEGLVAHSISEGAVGYVIKEMSVSGIVDMLGRAVDGQMAVEPALLRRALRPTSSADDPLWGLQFLTDREWDVTRCIMEGLTTEEIARSLSVRRSTARTHVQNVLTKLGVHSRLQAAALLAAHAPSGAWEYRRAH